MTAATRRTRERVVDSAGVERVQTKAPRADVLHYPGADLTTVLVRRTHDVPKARALAEARWDELLDQGLVEASLGTADRCVRVGWWTTREGRLRERHRVVTPSTDTDAGAGPGVEFRP